MAIQAHMETNNEEFLTPEQAAKILKCSVYTIIRRCKAGRLPAINLGSDKESMWRISFRGLQEQAEKSVAKRGLSTLNADQSNDSGKSDTSYNHIQTDL